MLSTKVRVWKPVLDGGANCRPTTVFSAMRTIGKTELRPCYNRNLCWNLEEMCDLPKTVMASGLIPPLTLYKYQHGDDEYGGDKTNECIDGQHRLTALKHYCASKSLSEKRNMMITIRVKDDDGSITHLFYKESPDVATWKEQNPDKNYAIMTPEECSSFDNYQLDIKEINGGRLTMDERRELFLSLSKGRRVTGSDLDKNRMSLPLVRFMSDEMRWEKRLREMISSKCYVKAVKFWLHWGVRFFTIMKNPTNSDSFMLSDREIKSWLKKDDVAKFAISDEEKEQFRETMESFFVFVEHADTKKMSPTVMFALFAERLRRNNAEEDVMLRNHILRLNTNRQLWEKPNESPEQTTLRRWKYEEVSRELTEINGFCAGYDSRPISRKMKDTVWKSCNGDNEEGKCFCCKEVLRKSDSVCAHIVARSRGGQNTEDNLRAACKTCNSDMGERDMREWMAKEGHQWVEYNNE